MNDRPNIVYVIYHADGSVKEVQRTEYQAKKKAGEMGLEWWPCVLTKILGNVEPVSDECEHDWVVMRHANISACMLCGLTRADTGKDADIPVDACNDGGNHEWVCIDDIDPGKELCARCAMKRGR